MKPISTTDFAHALGISRQAAHRAFQCAAEGKPWKGFTLPVFALPGNPGGAGGKVWALAVDRCPAELKAKLGVFESPFEAPLQGALNGKVEPWQWEEQADRLRIIQPVLSLPKRSAERVEAFRRIAAERHFIRGCPTRLAENTIRDWVRLHELQGPAGLIPALRGDKGKARVLFTREWDAGIDLPFERRAAIAARLTKEARSMVGIDGTSIRETLRLCSDILCRLSAEAGSAILPRDLRPLCQLNFKWAERIDLERYRLHYRARKDHKTYQDRAVGRVNLALADRPMSLVQGDVHYMEIDVDEQADPVRVRLIANMDMSSLYLWVTPVLLSKGQGVVQADVVEAIAHVAMCPHGGIPEHFYLDNGPEYKAVAAQMARLSYLAQDQFGLTLAKPYSPTSKGSIEGLFNILEQIFKGLPGWIGGRRDNKKTANKGKTVAPYTRGLAQLVQDIEACVAIYNSRPQGAGSRLAGLSPKEALEMKIEATGFTARMPSEEVFDLIFSRPETRTVNQSAVQIDNRVYHGPVLHRMMPGEKVEVLLPLRKDRGYAWVNLRGRAPERIELAPTFAYGDRAGARYQAQLEAASNRFVRDLARDLDPTVSTFEHQKRAADMTPPRAKAPDVWTGPRVIDKTAPRKTEDELRDERARETLRQLAEVEAQIEAEKAKRAISGGHH
jgi:hypothetical protein